MPRISKKKILKAQESKKEDLLFLFESLSTELIEAEKSLDNVSYQIRFFGTSPDLQTEKQDCELMLQWIQQEFDEVKKALFLLNSHSLSA